MSEWIEQKNGVKYKNITINGKWQVVVFWGNGALYSYCPYCGYIHPCYKVNHEIGLVVEYDESKEFNYCPNCGTKMLEA